MRYLLPFLAVAVLLAGCNRPHTSRPFESAILVMPTVDVATTTTTIPAPAREGFGHTVATRASRSEPGRPPIRPAPVALSDLLDRLAMCESHQNPRAVGGGGRFFGAFQDTLTTWHDIGGVGNPIDFDYATQKALNARIPVGAWHSQFPTCSRRIGV